MVSCRVLQLWYPAESSTNMEDGNESTAEINSLLLTEISGLWKTSVIGVVEVKTKIIFWELFLLSLPSCRQRMMLFALLVHSKSCLQKLSPLWAPHLRRLLRDRATRDNDKPEVQPVSKPESLHSCIFS